jgi:hypothetical protein
MPHGSPAHQASFCRAVARSAEVRRARTEAGLAYARWWRLNNGWKFDALESAGFYPMQVPVTDEVQL